METGSSVSSKNPPESCCIGCWNRFGCHIAAVLLRSNSRRLACSAVPSLEILGLSLVPLLASDVNIVDRYVACQHCFFIAENHAESLEYVSSGLFGDPCLSMEYRTEVSVDIRHRHLDHKSPCLIPELAGLHDHSLADTEPGPAVLGGVR